MTKRFATAYLHRFDNPVNSVAAVGCDRSYVWKFEFGSLEFIWDLSFVFWNLMNSPLKKAGPIHQL